MFIEITTPQNPLCLENTLRPYKRGEKPFSPEVARQILQSTNHKKNIYDTLQLIANLPKEEQADYKDIILSTFDHREQPADTLLLAKKLAASHNFEDELNAILTHDPMQDTENGIIYASAPNKIATVISVDKKPCPSEYPEDITLICTNDDLLFLFYDFSKVKSLRFKKGASIDIRNSWGFPETLDLPMYSKIHFYKANLSTVKTLEFKKGAEADLIECRNLPETIDLSMCDEVNLSYADLSTVKTLKFKEGAKADLINCRNLPETLDLSMCDKVNLSYADLSTVKTLKFKEGAKADLINCPNLPETLDVSMCDNITLSKAGLSQTKTLTFKNKQQQTKSGLEIPENWQGKITYTDEQSPLSRLKSIFTR